MQEYDTPIYDSSATSINVAAAQVWWYFADGAVRSSTAGVYPPGSFIESLIRTMSRADPHNLTKLASAFPEYAMCVHIAKNTPDGMADLLAMARLDSEGM